jgi:ubiquinone/menaquinone biosynthesis C-methylase UbiE
MMKLSPVIFLRTFSLSVLCGLTVLFISGCACCRLADSEPEQSVNPGINDSYLKADQDVEAWVGRFERESREVFRDRQKIVDAVALKPGMDMADIGSGSGLFEPYFAKAVGPEGKVYAVDLVPDFLTHIEKKAQEAGLNNIETRLCTERDVSLPRNSIDVAFLCDVYHHFEYPKTSLASIHLALRKGGELVVIDFKRIPGESSDWILNHVRAGEEVVIKEIEAAGFEMVSRYSFLDENYMLRFRRR